MPVYLRENLEEKKCVDIKLQINPVKRLSGLNSFPAISNRFVVYSKQFVRIVWVYVYMCMLGQGKGWGQGELQCHVENG